MRKLYQLEKDSSGFVIKGINNNNIEISYPKTIYSQIDAAGEIEAILANINFDYHSNFLVFGIRNLGLIRTIRERKSKRSHLIIVEKTMDSRIFIEANQEEIDALLGGDIVLILANDAKDATSQFSLVMNSVQVLYNMSHLEFITCPYVHTLFPEFISEIRNYIFEKTKTRITSIGNDVVDTLIGVQNHVSNLHVTLASPKIKSLKNIYKDIPAIMVGAGPSMENAIPLLREYQDKALIFAVDTVVRKLFQNDVYPDAMATIERDDIVYDLYYKDTNYNEHTVFIGPGVVDSRTFDALQDAVIIHRNGDAVSRKICEILGDETVEIGLNCANVSYGLLKHMGCNPIILVGQELAFGKNGQKYFKDQQEVYDASVDVNEPVVEVEANEGGYIKTLKHYSDARVWFEQEINNDFTGRKVYNCTEGGAKIKGTLYKPLSEVVTQHLHQPVVKFKALYKSIKAKEIGDDGEKVYDFFLSVKEDFVEFEKLVLNIQEEFFGLTTTDFDEISAYIESLREKLHDYLFSHGTMTWIIQSLYFSFDARIHTLPVKNHTTETIQIMLIETAKYLDTLIISCQRLTREFEIYSEMVKEKIGEGKKR